MARATTMTTLQDQITKLTDYLTFLANFVKKKKPIQTFVQGCVEYVRDLLSLNEKKRKIVQRLNYEKYKLKKTELILAQNTEHVFLRGKSINQIR